MKLIITIFLFSLSNIISQVNIIQGKLLSYNNSPLEKGKTLLYILHDTTSNVSGHVDEEGNYKIVTKRKGLAFVEYSNGDNENKTVVLYLNGNEKINLDVYLSSKESKTVFDNKNRFQSDFSANYDSILQRQAALSLKLREYKQSGKDIKDFEFNWSPYKSFLADQIQKATNQTLKQELLFSYIDLGYGTYGAELDEKIIKTAFAEIPPISLLWSIEPFDLGTALNSLTEPKKYYPYIRQVIASHPDYKVREVVKNNFSPDRKIFKGKYFPAFSVSSLIDSTIQITNKNLNAKFTLIDFWATWCKPCLEEMPNLHKVYDMYKNKGLEIFSVSLDNNRAAPIKFIEEKWKMPWLKAYVGLDKRQLAFFEISGIPKTILLDPTGKIIATDYELRGKKLQKTIGNILEKK